MEAKNTTYEHCSVARVLEHVGEWYNILILRDVMLGVARFDDFQKILGISTNTLSKRLQGLVDSGLLKRRRYQERPPRDEYIITDAGKEFLPVVAIIMEFGNKHFSPKGLDTVIIDKRSGKMITPIVVDQATGKPINASNAAFAAGPCAAPAKREFYRAKGLPTLESA